jgi:hypothetical protein
LKRVLFDHNVPSRLARLLKGFDIKLARDLGWERLTNGKLLEAVEKNGFDILLTGDKSLRDEQTLFGRKLGIVSMPATAGESCAITGRRSRKPCTSASPVRCFPCSVVSSPAGNAETPCIEFVGKPLLWEARLDPERSSKSIAAFSFRAGDEAKEVFGNLSCLKLGGPGRVRTVDLFHAMEARSQLRHRPPYG